MSNRKADDVHMARCTNTNARGVCMYVGPCLECSYNRAKMTMNKESDVAKERIFIVVSTGDGAHIERLNARQLVERLNEGYWGDDKRMYTADMFDDHRVDLCEVTGLFIIEGDLVVPKAKKVVEEWSV